MVIDVLFPLVDTKKRGLNKAYLTGDDRWYTKTGPSMFYQKDIIVWVTGSMEALARNVGGI